MNLVASGRLRIGPFLLDLGRRGVYRDGVKLHLTPKPFDTLAYLVEHRDRTVSKQELLDRVWSGSAVTDGVLTQAIREVRRSLGDDADDPSFILTIPREGYRFVGAVQPEAPPPVSPGLSSAAVIGTAATVGSSSQAPAVTAHSPRLSRRTLLAPAGATAVVLVVVLVWLVGRSPAPVLPGRLGGLTPLTPPEVSAVKPVFSPDGAAIAYVSDGDAVGVFDVFVTDATGYRPRRITRGAHASGDLPVFTPDGSAIVFGRYRFGERGNRLPDLWRVPVTGGDPVPFIRAATGAGFSPNGREVAYTRVTPDGPALYAGPVDDLASHRELARPGFTPRWARDGRWIAFTSSNPEGGAGEVWLVSPDGGLRRPLTHGQAQVYGLDWIDSGRLVFASNQGGTYQLWELSLDGAAPVPLTSGVGDYLSPTSAPDASRLGFAHLQPTTELHVTAIDGSAGERVLPRADYLDSPRLSPDGRRVASVVSRADAGPRAYVIDLETGRASRLGDLAARGICWVDDDRVAVASPRPDGAVTDVRLAQINPVRSSLLVRLAGDVRWLSVAPDLGRVAYIEVGAERSRVVLRDLVAGTTTVLAEGQGLRAPRLGPDGRSVAWSASPQGAPGEINGIWVGRPTEGAQRVLPDGHGPVWSADGRALFFSRYADASGKAGVWRLDLATKTATQLVRVQRVDEFDVAGTRLVYAIASGRSRIFTGVLQ